MNLAPETARALEALLWAAIVELAEAGHDLAVTSQARPQSPAAFRTVTLAEDIALLARAAEAAGRHAGASG